MKTIKRCPNGLAMCLRWPKRIIAHSTNLVLNHSMMTRQRIAILRDAAYRRPQEHQLLERVNEAGFDVEFVDSIDGFKTHYNPRKYSTPVALIRWEENGGLYGELQAYQQLTQFLYEHRIAPITVDFAFWDHYNGLTFETVEIDNESSIGRQWDELPSFVDYESITGNVGNEIRRIRASYQQQRLLSPENRNYNVAVFNQCALRRSRIGQTADNSQWNSRIHHILGDGALFKTMPSPALPGFSHPNSARIITHDGNRALEQNANLAVHARYCLTNSSGVLNEFVVTDTPVVVTGGHRYTGRHVFYEMRYWEDLEEKSEDPSWVPPIRSEERAKFVHWNLRHQCPQGESSSLLQSLVERFQSEHASRPAVAGLTPSPSVKRRPDRCFLTGSDKKLEDLLPWWHDNLRKYHPHEPIVFADFGLSESMRRWCKQRGELLEIGKHPIYAWHNKPAAIWQCPYETRCWLDLDCEVVAPVEEIFEYARIGLAVTEDVVRGTTWEHAYGKVPLATGVVGAIGDCQIVKRWSEVTRQAVFRGDQESLNAMLGGSRSGIAVMPREFQWLRLEGALSGNQRLIHWTGVQGKNKIREMLNHE